MIPKFLSQKLVDFFADLQTVELVGYVARAVSIKNLDEQNIFIIQTVFILVAPAVMAAACYQAFGRVVLWVVPPQYQSARHLWLPARHITPLFVGFDVLSFFIQVIGGAMVASADTPAKGNKGKNVVLVGLGLQLVTFGFFVLASIRFAVVLKTKLRTVVLPTERNWQLFLKVVNVASVIILLRTISRFLQFVLGTHSYPNDNEWYFYVFDALLMFLVALTFVCVHPGNYLPYLGIRRKNMQFSKNADRGFLSRFARGNARVPLSSEDVERTAEMSRRRG